MGVVVEALDHERGVKVALKTLRNADPAQLLQFKAEFRSLADLHLVPRELARRGSRLSGGTSARPEADAISITAVGPAGSTPISATTRSPRGPATVSRRPPPSGSSFTTA